LDEGAVSQLQSVLALLIPRHCPKRISSRARVKPVLFVAFLAAPARGTSTGRGKAAKVSPLWLRSAFRANA